MNKIISIIGIVILLPVFILISFLIIINDGFPIFFIQKRIGANNTFFYLYKFRSMKNDTPNVATHLLKNPNQYLFEIGKLLRKLSLDELPNLINIVKGDMVFVGPRPALFNQDDLMQLRRSAGIDKLKPGITGWAQINGRDELSIKDKVAYEKEYIKRKSLFFDLKIIFLTIYKVIIKNESVSH